MYIGLVDTWTVRMKRIVTGNWAGCVKRYIPNKTAETLLLFIFRRGYSVKIPQIMFEITICVRFLILGIIIKLPYLCDHGP